MRNFLITKKTYKCGKMVQSNNFPAYDEETAKKLFGFEYVDVLEVPEKCYIKVL